MDSFHNSRVVATTLRIDPAICDRIRLAAIEAGPVRAADRAEPLDREIECRCEALRRRYAGRTPGEIEDAVHARTLYRAFGIDPTRTRPSSEALLRRVLRGQPLPAILGAVDLGNLCSLNFLLPIGLYDRARVEPPVVLREGRAGEEYPGIGKPEVHLASRPVLADTRGPFGNPTSDSHRTRVTAQTSELLMVVFAPAAYPAARLEQHVEFAVTAIRRHLTTEPTARVTGRVVEPAQ